MAIGTIVINDDLRTMQIPSSITLLGVESDDDVNRIEFQMPKMYGAVDLSSFEARINYINANGDGDLYIADDLAVDGDNMTFSWLVGRNACAYKGKVSFIVCLKKFNSDSVVVQEFNTTVYSLPVLEGLETTEAVVQQNPDIIEYILKRIEDADIPDLSNYYTKAQVNALKLPNPYKLRINGTDYDGSEAVDMQVEGTTETSATAAGQIIHVADAVPQRAISDLKLYDSNAQEVASAQIAITNKNLFRIDLLPASTTVKGLTFTKDDDGGITVNGTSNDSDAEITCTLDPHMFVVGETYTISRGEVPSGSVYVGVHLVYANSVDFFSTYGKAVKFTITKPVVSAEGFIIVYNEQTTINSEIVYPQLEVGAAATAFNLNSYNTMNYDGTVMPVLPASTSNLWPIDSGISSMVMDYTADSVLSKVDNYMNNNWPVPESSEAPTAYRFIGTNAARIECRAQSSFGISFTPTSASASIRDILSSADDVMVSIDFIDLPLPKYVLSDWRVYPDNDEIWVDFYYLGTTDISIVINQATIRALIMPVKLG